MFHFFNAYLLVLVTAWLDVLPSTIIMSASIVWGELMVTSTKSHSHPGSQVTSPSFSILHVNGAIVIRPRQAETTPLNADPLTERELQVLSLVAEGASNKIVADQLGICERTVKNHLTCVMTKLRASDRTHAVVTAVRLGWLAI